MKIDENWIKFEWHYGEKREETDTKEGIMTKKEKKSETKKKKIQRKNIINEDSKKKKE